MAELIDKDALMKDIISRFRCRPCIEVGNKCEYVHEILDEQPTTTEADIRAKAIEEFAEKLKWELGQQIFTDSEKFAYPVKEQEQICHQNMTLKRAIKYVDLVAEQLKGE